MTNAALALALVLRDFVGTPLGDADIQLIDFDPGKLEELAQLIPDPPGWVDQTDPTAHRLLFKVNGSVRSLEDIPDSSDALAAEMASILQDEVIGDLFRPWPEVTVSGRYAVLTPRIGADGRAEWNAYNQHFCPIGYLRESLPTQHW